MSLPMNPASRVYPDGDALPVSAITGREIMATFGAIRAKLASGRRQADIRAARLAARRMVILSLIQTIRGLERHIREAHVHSDVFLEAAADELVTLRNDLTIRLATRNN